MRAHLPVVLREQFGVARERAGLLHVLHLVFRDELWKRCRREQARAEAAAVRAPPQRHDGHAHVERLTGREAARVGRRIEGDVDVPVLFEIVLAKGTQLDAGDRQAERREPRARERASVRHGECLSLEHEAAVRQRVEDGAPAEQRLVGELREVVEAAERHKAVPLVGDVRRYLRHLAHRAGRVAELAVRQADDPLQKRRLARALRQRHAVDEEAVHGGKPRRRHIAEPRDLHGRRMVGERRQRVVLRMAREIHEDVDVILRDEACGRMCGTSAHIAPLHGEMAEPARDLVDRSRRVDVDGERLRREIAQKRREEIRHRVQAEITGNIADAQAQIGRAHV